MHLWTRSEFLRLSTFGALGLLTTRGVALPLGPLGGAPGIRPYLQGMRPDAIWISWHTIAESSGVIDWGLTADSLTNSLTTFTDTTLGDGYRYHAARLTNLAPATRYYYRVRNGATASEVFNFRTPMADGTKAGRIRILVAGDNQAYIPERRHEKLLGCAKNKIEQMYGVPFEEAINLVIAPGDLVDKGIMLHYRELHFRQCGLISPFVPIMTAVGNHELYSDPELVNYRKLFKYAELNYAGIISPDPLVYYAYKVGSICFIHTSSEPEHVSPVQTNWIRQLVDALKADDTTDLCVSVVHRPYRAARPIGDTSAWFANQIMPMLAETEKHVLTISGHHHYYNRGQTRDWPIYHMISGGTASTQDWSPLSYDNQAPYDEVQKTIFNWAWQVIEFDLATRTMEVRAFSEAHGRFPEAVRWTTRGYNSRPIDFFRRRLGVAAPVKPSIANVFNGPVNHPVVLTSHPFAATTGESLNSTWFQVAVDAAFIHLRLNRLRDVEKIFGDTGLPDLEPVDAHSRLDILACTVPENLPAGNYHARVRHRDTNAMWSAWSDVRSFQITAAISTAPKISMAKASHAPEEEVAVAYENAPGDAGNWIGIFRKGDIPGAALASDQQYVAGTHGIITFNKNLLPGEWFTGFFASGGHAELAPRVAFRIGAPTALSPSKENFAEGETVRLNLSNAPGGSKDWIGIYRVDQNPGSSACLAWQYAAASGDKDFIYLKKGYYYAVLMSDDGYDEISSRTRFSVGSLIAQVGMAATKIGDKELIKVNFSKGPGLPKDWIGLYQDGDVPGLHPEISQLYFSGTTSGQVTFDLPDLPAGRYWVAMFTNDTYTEASSRLYFDVIPHAFEETKLEDGKMRLRWKTVPGKTYTVQKNTSLRADTWSNVQTLTAAGATLEVTVPFESNSGSCYYRVRRN